MAPTSHSSEPCGACGWMKKLLFGGKKKNQALLHNFLKKVSKHIRAFFPGIYKYLPKKTNNPN